MKSTTAKTTRHSVEWKKKCHIGVVVLLWVVFFAVHSFAASTSTWVKIEPIKSTPVGSVGASYLSVNLVAVSVYQDSNWWTNLVERNRSALATVEVNGTLSGGSPFSDRRISPPIEIERNRKNIDFGWSQALIHDLPVNFTSLSINVGIAKTAEDGTDKLIAAANDLSKKVPALAASEATMGTISAVKLVADFIFDKKLAVTKLSSAQPLTAPAGTTIEPGYYAILAGTRAEEYQQYLKTPAGGTGLKWDGALLQYNGQPLKGVTYFIVEVAYKDNIFDTAKLPDAALTSERPWARLYRSAVSRVDQIRDLKNYNDAVAAIAQIKNDADQLLNEEKDYVQTERILIQAKVRDQINEKLLARRDFLNKDNGGLLMAPFKMDIQ